MEDNGQSEPTIQDILQIEPVTVVATPVEPNKYVMDFYKHADDIFIAIIFIILITPFISLPILTMTGFNKLVKNNPDIKLDKNIIRYINAVNVLFIIAFVIGAILILNISFITENNTDILSVVAIILTIILIIIAVCLILMSLGIIPVFINFIKWNSRIKNKNSNTYNLVVLQLVVMFIVFSLALVLGIWGLGNMIFG